MPTVHFGKKHEPAFTLEQSPDLIAVRTRSGRSLARGAAPVASPASAELDDAQLVIDYPEAGVEVYRVPTGRVSGGVRDVSARKAALRQSPDVRFAGGVLVDPVGGEPVLYTENLFVKFVDAADAEDNLEVLRAAGLAVKQTLEYAGNAYFVEAPEGTGQAVFDIAQTLLARSDVEYCHPELVRPRVRKGIFPQQWHLRRSSIGGVQVDAHANVEAAHALTRGEGITIAVIDDGVDVDHPEFSGNGKIVAPRDASLGLDDARPKLARDRHGTACAGVACANGGNGASGVAPKARLMPIRMMSGLGSQREADAFVWAADHGADVISCSWGPSDGDWWDPADPLHNQRVPLPPSTRLALDYATSRGRGGKGCVILFAAGNGNEPVDNDGYASDAKVIAVGACNDRGRRSVYSDFGRALWCSFPSNDFEHAPFQQPAPLTPGIWTTDRLGGAGYNAGNAMNPAKGDAAGAYTGDFGGTSSACPGAAGVVALMLAVNPALRWHEAKALLKRSCDRIDPAGGAYDASGHSARYGYGRLNARTAVELARPRPQNAVSVQRRFDAPIPDLQTVRYELRVSERTAVRSVAVNLEIAHSYIGDLVLTLIPPAATGVAPILLHNRAGGAGRTLKLAFDAATLPPLARFAGKSCEGAWTLQIRDAAAKDSGTLASFGLELRFAHADDGPRDAAPVSPAAAPRVATPRKAAKPRAAKRSASAKTAAKRPVSKPAPATSAAKPAATKKTAKKRTSRTGTVERGV